MLRSFNSVDFLYHSLWSHLLMCHSVAVKACVA